MSIKAMNWAWGKVLPPVPKIILLKLADIANDSGVCWPSVRLLASSCGVSRRTVQRHLNEFVEQGLLIITERTRENGSQTSNLYNLSMERVTECHGEGVTNVTPRTTILNNNKERGLKRKQLVPKTFQPNEKSMEWLKNNYPEKIANAPIETQKFINHYLDKGELRVSWQRSWQNWMINAKDFQHVKTKYLSSGRIAATNNEIQERIGGNIK
jgi:hypothetical protein